MDFVRPEELTAELEFGDEAIHQLFSAIAGRLELNTERIRVLFSGDEVDCVSGMRWIHSHEKSLDEHGVLVEGFQSDLMIGKNLRPESLLAELVRMLVSQKLVLAGYEDVSAKELGLRAEVATVFFGFGLVTINETVSCCQSTHAGYHYFSMVKLGALNSFGIGYLLALVLWHRNQNGLGIANYLRPDAELSFQKTVDYLEKTNDSLLSDPGLIRMDVKTSISVIEAQLKSCSPTGLLWLLEGFQGRVELPRDVGTVKTTLFELVRHRDNAVARMALHLISFAEKLDSGEVIRLQRVARSRCSWMSAVAANILSSHLPFEKCENEFSRLLARFDHDAAANAAHMAHRFGLRASTYEATIFQKIKMALNRCNGALGFWYMLILTQVSPNPEVAVSDAFGDDQDLMRGAAELLNQIHDMNPAEFDQGEERPQEIKDVFAIPAWISI